MKVVRLGIIAAAVLAVATVAWAQKPDFSGTWTLDPEVSAMGGGGGAPGGGGGGRGGRGGALGQGPATVTQTADTLTIERMQGDNKVVTTYKLDGSESKNTMTGRGGMTMESTSVAKMDGNRLVISTKMDMGGTPIETSQTWTVSGGTLTIETTGGRGGPQKLVYKKS